MSSHAELRKSRAGDVFENPITGEHGYIRLGTLESGGKLLVADLRVRPGGAVLGPHMHPSLDERFTVLEGKIGYMLGETKGVAGPGESLDLPRGVPHDWWNAGDGEAHVMVEVRPADRFEQMAFTMFSLAREGKTNAKGVPHPLQMAVIAQEYSDILVMMSPPPAVQKAVFGVLAPLGRMMGYRALYPQQWEQPVPTVPVEPLPPGYTLPAE